MVAAASERRREEAKDDGSRLDSSVVPRSFAPEPTRHTRNNREAAGRGETRVPKHPRRIAATGREESEKEGAKRDSLFLSWDIVKLWEGNSRSEERKLPINLQNIEKL